MTLPGKIGLYADFDGAALPAFSTIPASQQRTVQEAFLGLFEGQRTVQDPNDPNSARKLRFEAWQSADCFPTLDEDTDDQPKWSSIKAAWISALDAYKALNFDHHFTQKTVEPICEKIIELPDGTKIVIVNVILNLIPGANFEGIPAGFNATPPDLKMTMEYPCVGL